MSNTQTLSSLAVSVSVVPERGFSFRRSRRRAGNTDSVLKLERAVLFRTKQFSSLAKLDFASSSYDFLFTNCRQFRRVYRARYGCAF